VHTGMSFRLTFKGTREFDSEIPHLQGFRRRGGVSASGEEQGRGEERRRDAG